MQSGMLTSRAVHHGRVLCRDVPGTVTKGYTDAMLFGVEIRTGVGGSIHCDCSMHGGRLLCGDFWVPLRRTMQKPCSLESK